MSPALLAAGGPVWWITVVTASVTGLLGLGAGASAAALVTARHETIEAFRNRMIEIGDTVINESVEARQLLQHGFVLIDYPQYRDKEKATETLQRAADLIPQIQQHAIHLYLIFAAPKVGQLGSAVANKLAIMLGALNDLLSDGRDENRQQYLDWSKSLEADQGALLHLLNREIRLAGQLPPFLWMSRRLSKRPRGDLLIYYPRKPGFPE